MNLLKKLERYKTATERELRRYISEKDPKELYELMRYHVFAGGKRVRPALCLLSCEAVSGSYKNALPIAAAIELTHAFSLVHDDIMDHDDMRRGKPTVWKKYGEALAINVGDGIFTKAFETAFRLKNIPNKNKILENLSRSILEVCEGQAMDISFETKKIVTFREYIKMANKKTAALIRASTELGAMCGGGSKEEVQALKKYGEKIGLAFQIWDDYIDFASEKTGKTYGSDIIKGKKTSIVCHALEHANETQKKKLVKILETPAKRMNKELILKAAGILEEIGSIEFAKNYAFKLVRDAKRSLKDVRDSRAKEILLEFADFLVKRED